jgi:hypothetical protein
MMDNKIYKLLFTLAIVFLLSFAAINWTETVTFSQKILNFIDRTVGNSKSQPAATVSATGDEVTSETPVSGGNSGGNNNTPPPPPPPPPNTNQQPLVNAGPDQTISLSSEAVLSAVVSDDGKPNPPALLGMFWSQVSGPDMVVFTSPISASTNAIFSSGGSYVLRLTAFDGEFLVRDDVAVTVNEGSNGNSNGNSNNNSNNFPTNPNSSNNSLTTEELLARIQELQAILRSLQSSPTNFNYPSLNSTTNSNTPGANLNLSLGSTGPAVTALQKFLVAKKFLKMPAGSAYGTFGPATKAALAKFQSANLIYPANGYYGLITRKLVNQLK